MSKVEYTGITGIGMYVPEKRLTNADLEKMVDTSDEWITTRSGIKERHILAPEEAVSDIGANSARIAMKEAGVSPEEIDGIIFATLTGDTPCPATACHLQHKLGAINSYAFDLGAACSGFVYGLAVADSLIRNGVGKTILVIGADSLSRVTDYQDRGTCVLFGDGGGAAIVQANTSQGRILSHYMGADGSMTEHIIIPAGGSRLPASHETIDKRLHYVKMAGNEVFKFAVRILVQSLEKALERCGHSVKDLKLIVPHQANFRILEVAARKMELEPEIMYNDIANYGNTSAGTIPIALSDALKEGRIKKGDLIALVAFGGGLTWGSVIIEW